MRDIIDELEDIEATMESEEEKYKREIASLKEEQKKAGYLRTQGGRLG